MYKRSLRLLCQGLILDSIRKLSLRWYCPAPPPPLHHHRPQIYIYARSGNTAKQLVENGNRCTHSIAVRSDVRGQFRTQYPKQSQNKSSVRKMLTFVGHCFLFAREFVEQMFKISLNLCSHIQSNTQNPNTIFKISIYCTKQTTNAKTHSNFRKMLESFETFQNKKYILLFI